MARTVRGLLFDLDGTLVDTAGASHGAYAAALAEAGIVVEPHTLAAACAAGRHWSEFLPGLIESAGGAVEPAAVARRKGELYRKTLGETRVNAPLVALVASSRPHLRTALVTTASAESVHALLRVHDLGSLFDAIVTGDDVRHRKPHPEAYRLAVSRLALTPEECLAFEDSDVGVASATRAGLAVIRVLL
jgi:beta-phosphoglucomutase-like phosphatase (HAD superfamily)